MQTTEEATADSPELTLRVGKNGGDQRQEKSGGGATVFDEVGVPTALQRNKAEGRVDQDDAIPTVAATATDKDH